MEKGYSITMKKLKNEEKLNFTPLLKNINVGPNSFIPDLTELKKEFKEKEILDGDMIENLFFPIQKEYDVFISHSHADKDVAERLATYLVEKKNLKIFLDSKIWGSADQLLKLIDDKYCKNDSGNYSYEKRNFSTSHVYSLLNSALAKAIEKSKILIFITSENSISYSGNLLEKKVKSPWIYQELSTYNLIMRQQLSFALESTDATISEKSLQIERSADMSNLKECFNFKILLEEILKN